MGYDRARCAAVFDAFLQEVQRSYRRRAKRELGLGSQPMTQTGTVTFIQRFDGALRLTPHAHSLVLDGVYVRTKEGGLVFHALAAPTQAEVSEVARRTAERIARVLRKRGHAVEGDEAYDGAIGPPAIARVEALGQLALAFGPCLRLDFGRARRAASLLTGSSTALAKRPGLYYGSSTMPRTTSYTLGDELDQFVQEQVDSGAHESASAVVRAALSNYAEQQRKRRALDEALALGLGQKASIDSKTAVARAKARIRDLRAKARR